MLPHFVWHLNQRSREQIAHVSHKSIIPLPQLFGQNTLVQMYDAPDFEVYHYDLYRLKTADEIFELDIEEAMYEGVCLIEWPEKMGGYLPRKAIKIQITPKEQGRQIEILFNSEETYKRFLPLKD